MRIFSPGAARFGSVSYDRLLDMMENKYTLAVVVAKRARQLHENARPTVETAGAEKPVIVALRELGEGKLQVYSRRQREREQQAAEEESAE